MRFPTYTKVMVISLLLLSCSERGHVSDTSDLYTIPSDYTKQVLAYRSEVEKEFKSADSPLPDSLAASFSGLHYFDIDTNYRVVAKVEHITDGKIFRIEASGNIADLFQKVAVLHFSLGGMEQELHVYMNVIMQDKGEDYFFIPFRDATNGNETYVAGRYLDMEVLEGDAVVLDFNYCYQPYCAYNHTYSCPIPPMENTLTVPVRAGERM
ncbi:MAG: DUF1684 domain-containing protein [Chitinophagales bacterium]